MDDPEKITEKSQLLSLSASELQQEIPERAFLDRDYRQCALYLKEALEEKS